MAVTDAELSVDTTERVRARTRGCFVGSSWITATGVLRAFSKVPELGRRGAKVFPVAAMATFDLRSAVLEIGRAHV